MTAPSLTLVDIPIKIRELNEEKLLMANLNDPVILEYEIQNSTENVIDIIVSVEENEDFYIGGELRSSISLMPLEAYILRYNLLTLQIGRLAFPKLNILDKDKNITLIKGYTRKCLVVKKIEVWNNTHRSVYEFEFKIKYMHSII